MKIDKMTVYENINSNTDGDVDSLIVQSSHLFAISLDQLFDRLRFLFFGSGHHQLATTAAMRTEGYASNKTLYIDYWAFTPKKFSQNQQYNSINVMLLPLLFATRVVPSHVKLNIKFNGT